MDTIADFIKSIFSTIPKAISFVLWVLCAFIILPCVFIAGSLYPLWSEWGEGF